MTKMLFNQISTHSMVCQILCGPSIIGLLVIKGILYLLLEPELLEDLEVDLAGVKLFPAAPLVLESKTSAYDDLLGSKGGINAQVTGPILHSTRFADC